MGCAQSKIDNEESVTRCKDRRNFMKERRCFRSKRLRRWPIRLRHRLETLRRRPDDYAQGEAENNDNDGLDHHRHNYGSGDTLPPPPPMLDTTTLPPPPPPLPTFYPITPPLQRSVTMPPEFKVPKVNRKMKSVAIAEDEEYEEESDDVVNDERDLQQRRLQNRTPEPPPPPPDMKAWDYFFDVDNMQGLSLSESEDVINEQKDDENDDRFNEFEMKTPEEVMAARGFETQEEEMVRPIGNGKVQFMHSNTAPPDIRRGSASSSKVVGGSSVNLLKILGDIDDHFLKASEAAQEVSKMLEATRLHYHSNFTDNRGEDIIKY